MERVEIELKNPEGLHARPAAIFVRVANKFSSEIEIESQGKKVNGKSIIGIMSLGAFHGEKIAITARGTDSSDALAALVDLISNEFEEL